MQKRTPRKKKLQSQKSNIILSNSKNLICLNQEKVRKDYIRKCKRSIKDLEKIKQEILNYEKNDLPSFEKWYNSQFGKLLSEIREFHEKAGELYHKIREIEYYKNKKKISYYEAFLLVEDKLKNPEKYKEEEPEHEYFEFSDDGEYEFEENEDDDFFNSNSNYYEPSIEEEIKNAFSEFLRENPEYFHFSKNPKIYKILYENFRKNFYENYYFNHKEKTKSENDLEIRIKAKYRELARKLHPDYRQESHPHLDELWYEVQKAYKDRDLNRLEMLLALSSIHQGDFNSNFSISQILDVQKEYKEQIKALRARLKQIKKHEAWGFSKLESTQSLEKKISKRLNENLWEEKQNYEYFQLLLQKWSTPPKTNSKILHTTFEAEKEVERFFKIFFD